MMRQPYTVAIAMRYLKARRQSAFISFISAVSMLGIAVSVAVLIIVMAVVNGFESELERRILSVLPDARLYGWQNDVGETPVADWQALKALAEARDDVRFAAPFIEGAGLIQAGGELMQVIVRGVDPALEANVTSLSEGLPAGSFEALASGWNIVIGRTLASELGVGQGDSVTLRLPEFRFTLAGARNVSREFTVAGVFEVGMAEFDRGLALIGFDNAATLYRTRGRASGISLEVDDIYAADSILDDFGLEMANRFGEIYLPEPWLRRYQNIFESIRLTRQLLFITLSLVMAIAVFNIVSTLFMVVREKRGDIAILRTLGAAPRSILRIFMTQGSTIGLVGAVAGLALGMLLVVSLGPVIGWIESLFAVDLLSEDVYAIGDLPAEPRFIEVAQVCLLALVMSVLATIYPALRAARQPPAEALRHE